MVAQCGYNPDDINYRICYYCENTGTPKNWVQGMGFFLDILTGDFYDCEYMVINYL